MHKNIFVPDHYFPGNELELVTGGEPFFSKALQIIEEAKKLIHIQMYIFDEDDTGKMVSEALKKASQRGVDIYLAVDSYGSKSLSPEFVADLKRSGVFFKLFSPLPEHFYVFRMGRRLHNKVIVADHTVALVGGINIADKYRGSAVEQPWLDFAVSVKGPMCIELTRLCERIYREKYFGRINSPGVRDASRHIGTVQCRIALNDWFRRKNQIGAGYRDAFSEAKSSITIVASYFLPSRSLRLALKNAAARGVKIKVLLPGESDLPMAKRATRFLYQWLFRYNIAVYEWHESILHGKLAVVDNKWVTIGSYNLNHLSQYSSIEMNVEALDETFAISVEETVSAQMHRSTLVTSSDFDHSRIVMDKFLDWCSYTLARWVMRLLFFLVKREHRYKEKE